MSHDRACALTCALLSVLLQVLHSVSAAFLYRIEAAGSVPLGPAGMAILGTRGMQASPRQLLLYDTSKKPHVTETISAGFSIIPQDNLYATFYSSDGQGWSALMRSQPEWEALARAVMLARCTAASSTATPGVVCQDVAPGDLTGSTVEAADTVQVSFSVWAEKADARGELGPLVEEREAVKVDLVPGAAPRGFMEGLPGMRRGGRRFLGVPHNAVCIGAPLATSGDALFYLVTLNRIKKASKDRPPGTAPHVQAVTPAGAAQAAEMPAPGIPAPLAPSPAAEPPEAAAQPPPPHGLPPATPGGNVSAPSSKPGSPRRMLANLVMGGSRDAGDGDTQLPAFGSPSTVQDSAAVSPSPPAAVGWATGAPFTASPALSQPPALVTATQPVPAPVPQQPSPVPQHPLPQQPLAPQHQQSPQMLAPAPQPSYPAPPSISASAGWGGGPGLQETSQEAQWMLQHKAMAGPHSISFLGGVSPYGQPGPGYAQPGMGYAQQPPNMFPYGYPVPMPQMPPWAWPYSGVGGPMQPQSVQPPHQESPASTALTTAAQQVFQDRCLAMLSQLSEASQSITASLAAMEVAGATSRRGEAEPTCSPLVEQLEQLSRERDVLQEALKNAVALEPSSNDPPAEVLLLQRTLDERAAALEAATMAQEALQAQVNQLSKERDALREQLDGTAPVSLQLTLRETVVLSISVAVPAVMEADAIPTQHSIAAERDQLAAEVLGLRESCRQAADEALALASQMKATQQAQTAEAIFSRVRHAVQERGTKKSFSSKEVIALLKSAMKDAVDSAASAPETAVVVVAEGKERDEQRMSADCLED